MLKAYHAIGTGIKTSNYREIQAQLFDHVAAQGVILPARNRVQRAQMYDRCLGLDRKVFKTCAKDSANAFRAIREMAEEVVETLPVDGNPNTKFTCFDLLAGDFDRIFLTVERWFGNIQNGFVFDSEELIRNGAVVRDRDVIDDIHSAIEKTCQRPFSTVSGARRSIERSIRQAVAAHTYRDSMAVELLKDCLKDPPCIAEVVWPGPLPLDAAVEAWRDGTQVFPT